MANKGLLIMDQGSARGSFGVISTKLNWITVAGNWLIATALSVECRQNTGLRTCVAALPLGSVWLFSSGIRQMRIAIHARSLVTHCLEKQT